MEPITIANIYASKEPRVRNNLAHTLSKHPQRTVYLGDLNHVQDPPMDAIGMQEPPIWEWLKDKIKENSIIDTFRRNKPLATEYARYSTHYRQSASRLD